MHYVPENLNYVTWLTQTSAERKGAVCGRILPYTGWLTSSMLSLFLLLTHIPV